MKSPIAIALLLLLSAQVHAAETSATQLLRERTAALEPAITQVSPSVYTATGFSPANISMIVGDDGIVIVDAGMFPAHAETVLAALRGTTDLPVRTLVLGESRG